MIKKEWKVIEWGDECPNCGGAIEAFAEVGLPEGHVHDGDKARCVSCGCPAYVSVADVDDAWVCFTRDCDD